MIYLDPPYGIKFGSNWQVSTRKREVKDGNTLIVSRLGRVRRLSKPAASPIWLRAERIVVDDGGG